MRGGEQAVLSSLLRMNRGREVRGRRGSQGEAGEEVNTDQNDRCKSEGDRGSEQPSYSTFFNPFEELALLLNFRVSVYYQNKIK